MSETEKIPQFLLQPERERMIFVSVDRWEEDGKYYTNQRYVANRVKVALAEKMKYKFENKEFSEEIYVDDAIYLSSLDKKIDVEKYTKEFLKDLEKDLKKGEEEVENKLERINKVIRAIYAYGKENNFEIMVWVEDRS